MWPAVSFQRAVCLILSCPHVPHIRRGLANCVVIAFEDYDGGSQSQAETELARRRPSFGERRRGRDRDVVSFAGERSQDAVSFAMDLKPRPARSR